jgi:hypothetical protein
LRWTRWYWDRFSLSASVSPASSQSTDCSALIIYHPVLVTIGQIVAGVPNGLVIIIIIIIIIITTITELSPS